MLKGQSRKILGLYNFHPTVPDFSTLNDNILPNAGGFVILFARGATESNFAESLVRRRILQQVTYDFQATNRSR
jgi:hypothetical protein